MTYRLLSLNGAVGYSFPEESLAEAMKQKIDLIADDSGSMDAGPYYLGAGVSAFKRPSIKRDFALMLKAALTQKCPLVLGTCGMSGDTPHMEAMIDIAKEVFEEQGVENVKVAVISSHVDPRLVLENLDKLTPLGHMPQLTRTMVEKSAIVAAMGIAPFIAALDEGAQVILGGRSCDVAIFASDPVRRGIAPGLAFQAGHVLECGAIACEPGSASDCLLAEFSDDGSVIFTPPNKTRKATPYSVAAHSLYEENHPTLQYYPEGVLAMENTGYFEVPPRSAGIRNAVFVNGPLSIKLEGSMCIGKRMVSYLALRDDAARADDPFLDKYLVYGRNGVERSPLPSGVEEMGVLITVRGRDEGTVAAVASILKGYLMHFGYPGRITTAGNLAFPISPMELVRKENDGIYTGLVISGTREPLFIKQAKTIFESVMELGRQQYPVLLSDCEIEFITSDKEHPMMFLDTIADTEEEARLLHGKELENASKYVEPGHPSFLNVYAGDTYVWSIYHILHDEVFIKEHLFPVSIYEATGRDWNLLKEVRPRYEDIGVKDYTGIIDEKTLDPIMEVEQSGEPVEYKPLTEMVKVLRSKDAGVNTITYDLFFKTEDYYQMALASNLFTRKSVADILGVPEKHIIGTYRADPCYAIKISRYREMISGTPGSPDGFGAQQQMRIESLNIPVFSRRD